MIRLGQLEQHRENALLNVLLAPSQGRTYPQIGIKPRRRRGVFVSVDVTGTHISNSFHSWLYRLFVGLDANFRLKRKKRSHDSIDPGLNRGYAYFVEETQYKTFLNKFDRQITHEQNTCHNHDAVKLANMKKFHDTDVSGVATVECTRHNMKRPSSVGDLQRGER